MTAGKDRPGHTVFDEKDPHPERKIKTDPGQKELQEKLDESLKETFPASDTPAASQGTTLGTDKTDKTGE